MGSIVAIGGGEIGRPGYPVETTSIDREIIKLSGSKRPRFLFMPTALRDAAGYLQTAHEHFGARLGCDVDVLYLYERRPDPSAIRRAIDRADIVYVGGGNTLRMMMRWRECGVDHLLERAFARGTVLSGVSAGAICWFFWGSSDSRRMKDPEAPLIRVRGLGLVPVVLCPHYHAERDRVGHLRELMKRTSGVAIALDDCCAIEIVDGRYRVLASRSGAAYVTFWRNGQYHETEISRSPVYRDLDEMVNP